MATLLTAEQIDQGPGAAREIEVPAPTAWPFVLAVGFTLLFAGLLTSVSVSVLGAVLALTGCVGWFKEVFPRQHERLYRSFLRIFASPPSALWLNGFRSRQIKCAHGFPFRRTQYQLA